MEYLKQNEDSQFVDLYLNGEYSGLYLLTEKIEIHENRLNMDESSGDFLCKIDLWGRMELIVVTSAASKENIAEENKRDNERLLWVAVFLSMLVCMLLADGCLRRRERKQEQRKIRLRQ